MTIEGMEALHLNGLSIDEAAHRLPGATSPYLYTISDLAAEHAVTLRALRFYEAKGLLKPQRIGSSRLYSDEDRRRLKLIIKGKQLGFTLREIIDLIESGSEISAPNELGLTREQCMDQIKLLERQKRELESAILELRRTYSALCEQGLGERGTRRA